MNGDKFRRVRSGQKLRIPAAVYNTLIDSIKKQPLNFKVYHKPGAAATPVSVQWGTVIVAVSDLLPEAEEDTPEYVGSSKYVIRPLNSTLINWVSGTIYVLGAEVIDNTDTSITDGAYRAYRVTNPTGVSNATLAPHENATDWTLSDEIIIEHAWGLDHGTPVDLKNVVPRYEVGAIVKYISRQVIVNNVPTTRYYLDCGCSNIDDYDKRSIGIIKGKLHAVWV